MPALGYRLMLDHGCSKLTITVLPVAPLPERLVADYCYDQVH